MVCGDLYQLPAVNAKPVFTFNVTETMEGFISMDLWHKFKSAELDQVMRQDDDMFVNLLNKIRKDEIDQNVKHVIKSRFIDKNDSHYSGDTLHILAENAPVTRHNNNQLKQIPGELVKIQARDQLPKNCGISDAKQAQKRKQSEIGGLAYSLELKINARAMLITNINIEDRLINGQIGTVKHIEIKENEVRTIYLELDDKCAGQIRMSGSDITAKNNKWVPTKTEETYMYLNKYKTISPAIKRTQFPLALSWACTVNKVQGLSLMSVVVSSDLENQKSFDEGHFK